MTAVVSLLEKNGTIWIGADTLGSNVGTYMSMQRADTKIFLKNGFIFGFTSSYRMGQILKYSFIVPKIPSKVSLEKYMHTTFINKIRKTFKEKGYSNISENEETGGTFIVGTRGRIFGIYRDFQIVESIHPYMSIGCGSDICLGSMYTTQLIGSLSPKERIIMALEAAEEYSLGVRKPFTILNLKCEIRKKLSQ